MKHLFRFLALAVILVTVTTVVDVRPTTAGPVPCVISSGTLPAGQSTGFIPVPAGKVYRFHFTGGAIGSLLLFPPGSSVLNGTGGTIFWTLTDEGSDCQPSQFFNPGDGRIDGRPADRIVVYCNTSANPPNLAIYGVGSDSKGIFLATVNFADLLKAGNPRYAEYKAKLEKLIQSGSPDPVELDNLLAEARREAKLNVLVKKLGANGTLLIIVDDQNSFTVSWTGGPYGANGQGVWAKSFKCDFKR